MVFETARKAGWLPDDVEVVHVQIGNVLGPDGKILKTRSGAPIRLRALLDEAVDAGRGGARRGAARAAGGRPRASSPARSASAR